MAQNKITIKFEAKDEKKLINAIDELTKAQQALQKGLTKTASATKKVNKQNKKAGKSSGMLSTNHKRLAATNSLLSNSFATIRSKMLLWSFAMSLGIRQTIQMAKESTRLKSVERGFNTLAGATENSQIAMRKLQAATGGTMSKMDLLTQANNAMILGVSKNSDEMADMFDIAQRLGRALGRDTKSSVESLITGIGRQSRLMLDNIGIIVKAEDSYQAYADSIGVSVDNLTDQQKKLAFNQAAMKAARDAVKRLGEEQRSAQDAFDGFNATLDDFSSFLGDKATKVILPFLEGTAEFMKQIMETDLETATRRLSEIGLEMESLVELQGLISLAKAREDIISNGEKIKNMVNGVGIIYGKLTKEQREALGAVSTTAKGVGSILSGGTSGIVTFTKITDISAMSVKAVQEQIDLATDSAMSYGEILKDPNASKSAISQTKGQIQILTNQVVELVKIKKLLKDIENARRQLAGLPPISDPTGGDESGSPKNNMGDFVIKMKEGIQQAQLLQSAFSSVTSAISKNINTRMNQELEALKASDSYKRASDKKKETMEKRITNKYKKNRQRVAKFEKATSLTQAGINIAQGITGALAKTNIPLAVLIGAMGAVQLAAIAATPLPKFATGGLIGGRRHSQGGTMIEAEQGEFVMSRNAVDAIGLENLNRMNQGGGRAVNVTFTGNVMSQDFIEQEAIPQIKEAIRRGADIGVS